MGRRLGVVIVVLALGAFAVPGAGLAAEPTAPRASSTAELAALAAELPTPSCAEGPEREGEVIVGTACADHIVVPPTVTYVDGGPGNDVIEGSQTTAASTAAVTAASGSCEVECHLEVGSQTFEGGPGDDIVYGDRGNDILRGNAGDDRLYGGIGDDRLEGGPGNDWLSGGFGSDTIDGQEGDDFVRGDGTIDHIFDTGGGFDTLSFATGVTPGFPAGKIPASPAVGGFPETAEGERGVLVNLGAGGQDADDGVAASGGGVDEIQPGVFERIIGSPFADYIVGTGLPEEIIGGGGSDVILGGGGVDTLRGGADGDYLEGAAGSTLDGGGGGSKVDFCTGGGTPVDCGSATAAVVPRPTGQVSVGETGGTGSTDVYVTGSEGADGIEAVDTGATVEVQLSGGGVTFNMTPADAGGCAVSATHASCPLVPPSAPNIPPLDAIVIAGMGGNDIINAAGFPAGVNVIALGGAGADTVNGGPSEDVLVDGPPSDTAADALHAGGGDDALLHNGGADYLDGGEGSDLFLSVSICDGETIDGGSPLANDRDNASWARLPSVGVDARLDLGVVGVVGANEAPVCPPGDEFDHLTGIEDLEGSEGSDVLYGAEGDNQLLGHRGEDTYRALGGNDTIFANSGTRDRVIDCGEGEDRAVLDLAAVGDPAPVGCEGIREGTANEFETEISQPVPAPVTVPPPTTTPPPPPPPVVKPKPTVDRTPPVTKPLRRPASLLRVRPHRAAAVVFRFAASERSRFECKLDAKPYRRCHSPVRAKLRPGRHTFRVFAIDAAGNRDKTPALVKVRVTVAKRHGR
jgi:RTX calcium-binding nonapeptide repeat (4 copies)